MNRIAIAAGLALAALVPATAFAHESYYAPAPVYYEPTARYHDDDYWRERAHYRHERRERERERHYRHERREQERYYWHERREWERHHHYRDYD